MRFELSGALYDLVTSQSGVLSRPQAVRAGLPPTVIDNQLRSNRWQRLQHGVYATFTGVPGRDAILWAMLLRAGPQAALSHRTAAELHGLTDEPSRLVHLTVPATQRVASINGVILHHTRAFDAMVHPTAVPPRTRVEDTVLELVQASPDFDEAFNWLSRAVGRGLTTPELVRAAIATRSRVRWRTDLLFALDDVSAGVRSPLERRYVDRVERAHGLPAARRQVHVVVRGQSHYIDNLYEAAMLAVELDGKAAHPPEQRWSDSHRDNAHAGLGMLTLRYNWVDVNGRACESAAEVATLLTMRGTAVKLRKCGRDCAAAVRGTS